MIRIAFFVAVVAALWIVVFQLVRRIRARQFDWRGVGLAILFVGLAFYLHQETGVGGLFEFGQ